MARSNLTLRERIGFALMMAGFRFGHFAGRLYFGKRRRTALHWLLLMRWRHNFGLWKKYGDYPRRPRRIEDSYREELW